MSFSVVRFTNPLWILIFQSSCQYIEVRAQLAALFNLDGTNPKIPMTPIASFAANTNTEMAYKQFCKDLYQIGVNEDMIRQNEDKLLEILRSQDMVASNQIGDSDIEDKNQVLEVAYKEYCKDLYRVGFTDDMLPPKDKILAVLRSRGVITSSQSGSTNTGDKG